jgi:hypothetical protein
MTDRTYTTSATNEIPTDHKISLPYDHFFGGLSFLESSLCCSPRVVALPITMSGPPSPTTTPRKRELALTEERPS